MATCGKCLLYEKCVTRMMSKQNMLGSLDELVHDCNSFKSKSDYVKRERGEWIKDEIKKEEFSNGRFYKRYIPIFTCSLCKTSVAGLINMRYCPDCGAYMIKEDNNER